MLGVERECRDDDARALFGLTAELADKELKPAAADAERDAVFPRDAFRLIGRAGLLSLPYPESLGGAGQPYETYLQVVEELAGAWLTIGLGVSVHVLSCFPLVYAGTAEQQERWLPSHAGQADFYAVFARTSGEPEGRQRSRGISCFHVPAQTPGVKAASPEHKMGMRGSVTAQMLFEDAQVPAEQLIGDEGSGFAIALGALDAGRLGIAACATGVAQAALDAAVAYATERKQFGRPVMEFQGLAFMLADMATSVSAARALYLAAARRKDAGLPYRQQAAMAKLFASDTAMKVTTDAVQVLGGYGYVEDFPVERLMREAKVLQIVEGTNQIQRVVISRSLAAVLARGDDPPLYLSGGLPPEPPDPAG